MNSIKRERVLPLLIGILFILLASTVFAEFWNYRQHTKIKWREYNVAAFSEATEKNKPLYIFVYSDECSWCRKFEIQTLEKGKIRKILEKEFIPIAINQVAQPELVKKLGIKLVPGNILLTPERKKILRFYGFVAETALSDALTKTLNNWRKGEILEEEFGNEKTCCPVPET